MAVERAERPLFRVEEQRQRRRDRARGGGGLRGRGSQTAQPQRAGDVRAVYQPAIAAPQPVAPAPSVAAEPILLTWATDAEKELKKIPFFVRGKARTNTETFARERHLPLITIETLYDAKAHYGR